MRTRAITAHGRVVLAPGRRGTPRIAALRTSPPLGVRLAGGEVHLVGTAGGPLGGDDLHLEVHLTAGTDATVRSVAATVALPGDGTPSRHRLDVHVGPGARLRWVPEPLVAAAGCDHTATATVHLAADAGLTWCDEVVLGRHGEAPGRLVSTVRIERDGVALVHHSLHTGLPGWSSGPVTAGHRVSALCVVVGASPGSPAPAAPAVDLAVSRLAADVSTVTALAPDHAALHRSLPPLP